VRDICERALAVGRGIDLHGCYFEMTGPYAYQPTNYYPLLAGLAATRFMRQVLDIGTRLGGSILAVRKALEGIDPNGRVLVTVDVMEHDQAALRAYPDVVRVLGDSIAEATVTAVMRHFSPPIDMLFVDAVHTYEHTKANIDLYTGALSPALVAIDDIHLNESMEALWAELVVRFEPSRIFYASTLTGRGFDCGFGVIAWCEPT
jgi:cephalosporin hydroxylase